LRINLKYILQDFPPYKDPLKSDYFKPEPGAFVARDEAKAGAAKAGLDALFGKAPGESTPSKTDAAHTKLEELFGSGDKEDNKRK